MVCRYVFKKSQNQHPSNDTAGEYIHIVFTLDILYILLMLFIWAVVIIIMHVATYYIYREKVTCYNVTFYL